MGHICVSNVKRLGKTNEDRKDTKVNMHVRNLFMSFLKHSGSGKYVCINLWKLMVFSLHVCIFMCDLNRKKNEP